MLDNRSLRQNTGPPSRSPGASRRGGSPAISRGGAIARRRPPEIRDRCRVETGLPGPEYCVRRSGSKTDWVKYSMPPTRGSRPGTSQVSDVESLSPDARTAVAMDGHPFVPAWLLAERGLHGSNGKEHSSGGVSRQQSLWICRSTLPRLTYVSTIAG